MPTTRPTTATTRTRVIDTPVSQGFTGIPREAFAFFADLARNNNRDWFQPRKSMYEGVCQDPLKALTAALDPPLGADRLSRIYRDVRFSKDKSPYKTHVSARIAGCVLWLSADGLYVGTGLYMPDPPTLRRLREAIDRDASGKALADLVKALRKKGYTVASHESVESVPRGYAADHPRLELLRMKDVHAGRTLAPQELSTAAAVAKVRKVCDDVAPLRQWLVKNVGATGCI
jgi:uncharacterized protein (TIGR02453 family)